MSLDVLGPLCPSRLAIPMRTPLCSQTCPHPLPCRQASLLCVKQGTCLINHFHGRVTRLRCRQPHVACPPPPSLAGAGNSPHLLPSSACSEMWRVKNTQRKLMKTINSDFKSLCHSPTPFRSSASSLPWTCVCIPPPFSFMSLTLPPTRPPAPRLGIIWQELGCP